MGRGRRNNFSSESVIRLKMKQLLTVTASFNAAIGKMAEGLNWVGVETGGVTGGNSRFSTLSDQFSYYRFRKLRHRVHPTNFSVAVSISPDTNEGASTVTSAGDVFAMGNSALFQNGLCTVPTSWADVDCAVASPLPWYKTGVTSLTALEEMGSQFTWQAYTSTASGAFNWEMEAEVEFKGSTIASLNPRTRLAVDGTLAAGPDEEFVRIPRSALAGLTSAGAGSVTQLNKSAPNRPLGNPAPG